MLSTEQTLHPEARLDTPTPLDFATTCEQGTQIVGIGHDGALYAWTVPSPSPRKIAIPDGPVHTITCAGSNTLAAWLGAGKGLVLDLNTGKVRARIEPKGRLWGFGLSPDGSLLAVSNNATPVQLWDTNTGQRLATGANHFGASNSSTFSPNGELFVSADDDSYLRAYDRHGKPLYTAEGSLLEPFGTAFTADSKHFASGNADGTISLYDSASGKKLKTSTSCGNPIRHLVMSPDSQQVMAFEFDEFTFKPAAVGLWDMRSDDIRSLTVKPKNLIGFGTNQSHLLLISQDSPQTIGVYSLH